MLFGYELKKIWRRVSPMLVLVVLLVTTIATVAFTHLFFNHTPDDSKDVSAEYTALATKINDWEKSVNRISISNAFNEFYADYEIMNGSILNGTGSNGKSSIENYHTARDSFNDFYVRYYQQFIYHDGQNYIADYLLVREKYKDAFNDILESLDYFFNFADINDGEDIRKELKYTNPTWEDASLQTILDNLFYVQTISDDDLTELKKFFAEHPAGQDGYDYSNAYDYAKNRFWIAVATNSIYTGNLSEYEGFDGYQDVATSTKACKLANYRLQHGNADFGAPFSFGNIFNNSHQISLFDFVFTNMEMAMIPVALLVMIWAACAFFTDNYQKTLVTPIAAGKKRSSIILTKMLAVMLLAVGALLFLTIAYLTCGLVIFHAYISPDILFLFNGTKAMVMSAANYFAVYFLNLVFKLLPLIAVCGLFSFSKARPFVIIGFTTLICAAVIVANLCLGSFGFYQFVPLMGLDPMRYFGAEMLFAPMPSSYNLWYTFPAMLAITVILYWWLIRKFRCRDF